MLKLNDESPLDLAHQFDFYRQVLAFVLSIRILKFSMPKLKNRIMSMMLLASEDIVRSLFARS